MSHFRFEGNSDILTQQHIELVTSVLQNRGFKSGTVTIEPVGKVDDNYAAGVVRIKVEENGTTFKMIAKIAPTNEVIRKTMGTSVVFGNEYIMYMKVLPKFSELEKDAAIPENERLRYAECYGVLMEEPNEIILLEDLRDQHFIIFNKHISLSDDAVRLVLKDFAKLHSLSYALKNQYPEAYECFKNQLYNPWMVAKVADTMKQFLIPLEESVIDMLTSFKHQKLVKGSVTNMPDNLIKNIKKYDFESKYSVIQQGDCWTNNIMYRLENEETPVQCCMIDYQNSSHNSPAGDLHYMIFNCTDYDTRSKHYHDWIDHYHVQLANHLSNFGLKANLIYPRDQLDADLRRLGRIFFGICIMGSTILMKESHENAKTKEAMQEKGLEALLGSVSNAKTIEPASLTRLRNRIEGLINSFLELGYL